MWAADRSMVVRAFQARFETPTLEVFAIGAGDKVMGPLNLRPLVERAVRARWKGARPFQDYVFSAGVDGDAKINGSGELRFALLVWIPKMGRHENFDVVIRITRAPDGLRGSVTSITPRPDKN